MILCDRDLKTLAKAGMLVEPYDESLVNPASIDIRIGLNIIREVRGGWKDYYIGDSTRESPIIINPGEFILVETLEKLIVPNGYAVECRLKSSLARSGLDHLLAFWFDPGWKGVGTLELRNVTNSKEVYLWYGRPIVQIIVHRLSGDAEKPYEGRYQNATKVELSKPEKK